MLTYTETGVQHRATNFEPAIEEIWQLLDPAREGYVLFEHTLDVVEERTSSGELQDLWWAHNCVYRFPGILPEESKLVRMAQMLLNSVNNAINTSTSKPVAAAGSK